MNFAVEEEKGIVIIQPLTDTINAEVANDFKNNVLNYVIENKRLLILNFSQVEFMDSSGLGSLIAIMKSIEHAKGYLILCEIKHQLKNLFKLTKLEQVFTIIPTKEDAIKQLNMKVSKQSAVS